MTRCTRTPLLALALAVSGCWKPDPGVATLAQAQGPVALVALPGSAPATDLVVMARAGAAHDAPGHEGLAYLTARMLREGGAGGRTPEQVDALLYRLGTDVSVVVDQEIVTLRARALHDDLPELADLMADMVLEPAFDPDAFTRVRDEAVDDLRTGIFASDEALGQQVLQDWLYAGNPYGHPVQGRLGSLEALDPDDLRAFLDERWVRSAVVLGVSGPAALAGDTLDPSAPGGAAARALRDRLAALPARVYRDVSPRGVQTFEGRHVLVVEKDTAGTGIHFGHPIAATRAHPDWPALLLAQMALGEHRQSHGRLYRALRTTRGLNYGDYAYLENYRQDGWSARQQVGTGRVQNHFSTWIRPVTADNGPFALKAALDLVTDWSERGLEDDELARMKAYLPARIALWGDEPIRRLGWAVEARLMGWPDPLDDLPARIEALTGDDVRAALDRHIHPSDLRVVVVTADGQAFLDALSAPSPIVYAGEAPAPGTPQAMQDRAWSEATVELSGASVVPTDGLFQ